MRILVTGGSGQLGTDVAQAAAAKGWQVWARSYGTGYYPPGAGGVCHRRLPPGLGGALRGLYGGGSGRDGRKKFVWLLMQRARRMWLTPARQQAAGCCIRLRIMCLTAAARPPSGDGAPGAPECVRSQQAAGRAGGAGGALHAILRISWVFGLHGNNFVKTMLRLAERRTRLSVVDDQIGCPTYTVDLARLICQMAEQNAQGVFHAAGSGQPVSWYDFARRIFDLSGKEIELGRSLPQRTPRRLGDR